MSTLNQQLHNFKLFIWDFYKHNGRVFAWRNNDNPYHILISEIMLQQTQTHRVIKKFEEFIQEFPTIESLALASLRDVLSVWQGLGYYRRARFLHETAKIVVANHQGIIPKDPSILVTFPGIGPNTAGSICAFAFNMPVVFIETNIRSVFLHHFFEHQVDISDKKLFPLISQTVDEANPREWYYALMDYGVFLKNSQGNPNKKSAHYTKQSAFQGSHRQMRSSVLKLITERNGISKGEIITTSKIEAQKINMIIEQLENEHFIKKCYDDMYSIK